MTAEERRESVLRAAVPEFAVGGLTGTSTEDIARRAGVSQPYLFRLFPSKKALFIASVQRTFERIATAFEEAADGTEGPEALAQMANAYGELLQDRNLLMHQMQAFAAADDPEVGDAARRGFGDVWNLVARVSGASSEEVRQFFATGMLINVVAALQLDLTDAQWALECVPPGLMNQVRPEMFSSGPSPEPTHTT
jgi:AcrR family transcriptional regulator